MGRGRRRKKKEEGTSAASTALVASAVFVVLSCFAVISAAGAECVTILGTPCIDYWYNGVEYNGCPTYSEDVPWCFVDYTTSPYKFGFCADTCPKATTFKSWGEKGDWGEMQSCPVESFAVGFKVKHESETMVDNTGTNAIEMECSDAEHTRLKGSLEGKWGEWEHEYHWCLEGYSQARFYYGRKSMVDNAGTTCVELYCKSENRWQGGEEDTFCQRSWDNNGPSEGSCNHGEVICGFSLQVQADQENFKDDTALNDIEFRCCQAAPAQTRSTECPNPPPAVNNSQSTRDTTEQASHLEREI